MPLRTPFDEQKVMVKIEITPRSGGSPVEKDSHLYEVILVGEDGVWEARRADYPYKGVGTTAIHAIVDLLKHACEQDW